MPPKYSIGAVEVAVLSATAVLVAAGVYYSSRCSHKATKTKRRVSFKVPGEVSSSLLPGTNKPIMGLLFAASWCPDCSEVVPAIGKAMTHRPNDVVEIFYVASETSKAEMEAFAPKTLSVIPFENVEQRADLKRHFAVCAAKELSDLGMAERKHGLPTLLLIETATGRILSETAAEDVNNDVSPELLLRQWDALRTKP